MPTEPSTRNTPSKERYEEIEAAEAKTGWQFSEVKQRFNPIQPPPSQELIDAQTIAIASMVRQTADLMCSCLHGIDIRNKTALFVIGATGSGKSSFANWLVGHNLSVVSQEVLNDFGPETIREVKFDFVGQARQFATSDENESKTFVPNVYELAKQDKLLIDFPGFFDTAGFDIRVGMDLGFRRMLNAFEGRARIIALIAIDNFSVAAGRAVGGRTQLEKIKRLVPTSSTDGVPLRGEGSRFCVGITRCDTNFAMYPGQLWNSMKAQVIELDSVMAGSIWNANRHMFRLAADVQTPEAFLKDLDDNYPIQRSLQSDCLDPKDMEDLVKYLKSSAFTKRLLSEILTRLDLEEYDGINISIENDDEKQSSACVPEALIETAKIQGSNVQTVATETLIEKAKIQSARVTTFATWIIESSDKLIKDQTLALADIDANFRWMENQGQPRLTKALAHVEQAMMKIILAIGISMHKDLKKDMMDLIQAEIIIENDKVAVKKAIEDSTKALDGLAVALGHPSRTDYANEMLVAGTAVVAVGGGASAITVAVSASAYAVLGLATGGVACLIVGGIATILAVRHKWEADKAEEEAKEHAAKLQFSNDIARSQISALALYVKVSEAATAHTNKLTAKIDRCSELEAS